MRSVAASVDLPPILDFPIFKDRVVARISSVARSAERTADDTANASPHEFRKSS